MKIILTESQLKSIITESFDDYKMSSPRSKSISKISSSLNKNTEIGGSPKKKYDSTPKVVVPMDDETKEKNKERSILEKQLTKLSDEISKIKLCIEKDIPYYDESIDEYGRTWNTRVSKPQLKKRFKELIKKRKEVWNNIDIMDK